MNVKLTIKDRIVLLTLLPRQGGLIELQTIKRLIQILEFTSEEIEKYQLKDTANGVRWNKEKEEEKEVIFTDSQINIIKKSINEADKNKTLTLEMLETIEKFINL